MIVSEDIAKQLLSRYGMAIPAGRAAATVGQAVAVARELGGKGVVKALIPTGGRG